MGVGIPTYTSHENGIREFGSAHAERYARAFGVNPAHLLMLTSGEKNVMMNGETILAYLHRLDERLTDIQVQIDAIAKRLDRIGDKG